jgi:hypothetical protein
MILVEKMCTILAWLRECVHWYLHLLLGLRKQPKYDLPDLLDCTISIRIMRIALVLAKPDFGLLLGTCFFATKTGEIL